MPDGSWGPLIEQSCNEFLVWVGFGTLVGLAAKAIMPGRDPGGAIATLLMGIAGCVIGCGTLFFFYEGAKVTPISPMVIERRAPCRMRERTSRPSRSEPNRKNSPSSGGQMIWNRLVCEFLQSRA